MLKNASNLIQSFPYSYASSILLLRSLIMFEISIVTCTCLNCTFYKQKGDSVYVILKEELFSNTSLVSWDLQFHVIFINLHIPRFFLFFQCLKFLFVVYSNFEDVLLNNGTPLTIIKFLVLVVFFHSQIYETNREGLVPIDAFANIAFFLPLLSSNMPNTFTNPNPLMLMYNTLLIINYILNPTKPIERKKKMSRKPKWDINKIYYD